MEQLKTIMKDIQRTFYLDHGWDSIITRGGYLIVDVPFDSMDCYEVEETIQYVLEEKSLEFDTHFCYDFYNDTIKIYVLN